MSLSEIRKRLRAWSRPLAIHLRYSLLKRKIDRDQWHGDGDTLGNYRKFLTLGWEETRAEAPDYFNRLAASVARVRGRVLEIGCGVGNMTRWIAERPEVSSVTAIDGSERAIGVLNEYRLPKVRGLAMPIDAIRLDESFDCLVLCETLEHLYPDEERALLASVLPHMAPGATYVISVPIGWLEDPHHVRAFSKAGFRRHLARYYGQAEGVDFSSGYSQVAWGPVTAARACEPVKSAAVAVESGP